MLFGVPDDAGRGRAPARTTRTGILNVGLRAVRAAVGDDLVVMADLCLDEFTDHGHCGVLDAARPGRQRRDAGAVRRDGAGAGRRRRPRPRAVRDDGRPGGLRPVPRSSAARTTPTWPSIIPRARPRRRRRACASAIVGVAHQRRVVVDRAVGGEHAAVPVVGELVQAQVRHHDQVVADLGATPHDRHVEDPVGVVGRRTDGVLALGHPEQHQPAEPGADRLGGGLASESRRVLHDARHRGRSAPARSAPSRTNTGSTRSAGCSRRLRDQPAERRRTPQPRGPAPGNGHHGHRAAQVALRRAAPRRRLGAATGSPASAAARRSASPCVGERLGQRLDRRGLGAARRPAARAPRRSSRSPARCRPRRWRRAACRRCRRGCARCWTR